MRLAEVGKFVRWLGKLVLLLGTVAKSSITIATEITALANRGLSDSYNDIKTLFGIEFSDVLNKSGGAGFGREYVDDIKQRLATAYKSLSRTGVFCLVLSAYLAIFQITELTSIRIFQLEINVGTIPLSIVFLILSIGAFRGLRTDIAILFYEEILLRVAEHECNNLGNKVNAIDYYSIRYLGLDDEGPLGRIIMRVLTHDEQVYWTVLKTTTRIAKSVLMVFSGFLVISTCYSVIVRRELGIVGGIVLCISAFLVLSAGVTAHTVMTKFPLREKPGLPREAN